MRSPSHHRAHVVSGEDALSAGLSKRYVDGQDFINEPAWHRANNRRELVGACRQPKCGGLLQPQDTHESNGITWYSAACLNCGHEVVSPNGRVLRRSSRRHEMPDGWWDRRMNTLTNLNGIGKGGAA